MNNKHTSWHSLLLSLNHPSAPILAIFIIPIAFGLLSLCFGQDANWDLRNYHLYNAYAWLNNRIGFDLAPAQMQTYFNPLLDIPYFQMVKHWPPRWIGFALGVAHGLAFVFLLGIVKQILPSLPDAEKNRTHILLALAGCISPGFLAELGNTMGDNATALLVLAALFVLLKTLDLIDNVSWHSLCSIFFAGVLMGFACGLKLTNAAYAVAICSVCLVLHVNWIARIRTAFVLGLGILLGFLICAGSWHWDMWQRFGNPVFPQFNALFNSPLAATIWVVDVRWLPKGWLELLLWPFLFTLNPQRIGEISFWQISWPVLYILFALWGYNIIKIRFAQTSARALTEKSLLLMAFILIGYLVWMKVFSVYRYLVPIELLAPLAIWILLHRLLESATARTIAIRVLSAGTVIVLLGFHTWQHKSWGKESFSVSIPTLASPDTTTMIFAGGSPLAWMVPFFPKSVAFASVLGTFPEGPAYAKRLDSMIAERNGPVYLMLEAKTNSRLNAADKLNNKLNGLGLTQSETGCRALNWIFKILSVRAIVQAPNHPGMNCDIAPLPQDHIDLGEENRATAMEKSKFLERYHLQADISGCVEYTAFIGDQRMPYQICPVRNMSTPGGAAL
jgi:hypothetical protein